MKYEKLELVDVIDSFGNYYKTKIYILFRENKVNMAIKLNDILIENSDNIYIDCLLGLIEKLPPNSKLLFNHLLILDSRVKSIVKIEEYISIRNLQSINSNTLFFELKCLYNNNLFEASAFEDFSIALQDLRKKMNVYFEACAFCKYSDFKSDGGEDLRHGWYCMRELDNFDSSIPWFNRLEEFDKAIPYISAFHWCPKFDFKKDKYY